MTEYSSYTPIISGSTPLAAAAALPLPGQIRCFLLQPTVVMAARVNMAAATYPLGEITFDGVTTGAYTAVEVGQVVLLGSFAGASDLGRGRVRATPTSSILYVGRSSRGVREGEFTATDNAYITVLDLYRVAAKIPYIASNGTAYKDGYLACTDQTSEPPPVANTGAPVAATIDADGIITVDFDGSSSFAVADGATIADYTWDFADGTVTTGTVDDPDPTVTFPAGFRWVSLTVTDSNGKTHTARTFVFARDSDEDVCIENFQISEHRITPQGQQVSVEVFDDISLSTYPESTLICLFEGEPASAADRTNILFWGWIQGEPIAQEATRTGFLDSVTLNCLDVAGVLDILPGFPVVVENDELRDEDEFPDITWSYMTTPNLDKFVHYILQWHSTALDLTDFTWSGTGSQYKFPVLGSEGQSLYSQANQRCQAFVPDSALTCNRLAQLRMPVDPMFQETADRTATEQATLTLDDWSSVRYTRQTVPSIHWLNTSAIKAAAKTVTAYFSVAPGDAPGQGEVAREHGEQLAQSQADLDNVTGHRYARINAPQSKYNVTLAEGDGLRLEPADLTWVRLVVGAAQRTPGQTFNTRGLPLELSIRYEHSRTGLVRTVTMVWEREVTGAPGVTVVPPVADPVTDGGSGDLPDWDEYEEPELYYDNPGAYVMWDGAVILRTWDIMDASPTWELINSGLPASGIMDVRTMLVGSTVGGWCMNILGIYICMDLMADVPTWSLVLDIADVVADEVQPDDGVSEFKCMTPYASNPAFLLVATGPSGSDTTNVDYAHCYFWKTTDYGANWTMIDAVSTLQRTVVGHTHGYCYGMLHGMEMMREEQTVLCFRSTPRFGVNVSRKVCISQDGGATWTLGAELGTGMGNNFHDTSILHPFPAFNRWSYGITGEAGADQILRSADLWTTFETVFSADDAIIPTGLEDFAGVSGVWRVNKHPYDNDHMIAWFDSTVTNTWHLLETTDGGATWTDLYDSGLGNGSTTNLPADPTPYVARYNTPNGWPANNQVWFIVRNLVTAGSPVGVIKMTVDNFANLLDKVGNLASVLPSGLWTNGPAGGIALPRLGRNL